MTGVEGAKEGDFVFSGKSRFVIDFPNSNGEQWDWAEQSSETESSAGIRPR